MYGYFTTSSSGLTLTAWLLNLVLSGSGIAVLSGCEASDPPRDVSERALSPDQSSAPDEALSSSSVDMMMTDSSVVDASVVDASVVDASVVDASVVDASVVDAVMAELSAEELWSALRAEIDSAEPDELVVLIGDQSGARFVHEKGATQDQAFPIASATKLLTAILTLRLVEEGVVNLTDHPQRYLDWWTDDPEDPRSRVTLSQLLSFTSGASGGAGLGLDEGIDCVEDGDTTLDACAQSIYRDQFEFEPGRHFFYGPAHMQLAAAMLTAATGEGWNALFRRLIYRPLNLEITSYPTPSLMNPRAAGGAVSSAVDYGRVLTALSAGTLLSAESLYELTRDHTPAGSVTLTSAPETSTLSGEWHYAYGCWRECADTPYSSRCDAPGVISSPGAFGFYPWLDQETGYWGVIATMIRVRGASVTTALGRAWYQIARRALATPN